MYEKQLKYVVTLAKEGSFSRAADTLDIAQPSLSQYIKKIEKQLGVELFDRSNGNVRLTDAGQIYVESGRKILELERQMDSRFQDIIENRAGTIRVGISAHRSVCLMPPVVKAFRDEYPGMIVVLDEKNRGALIDAAEHGTFDLCITTLPVDEKLFDTVPLFREELMVAVPRNTELFRMLSNLQTDGKVDIRLLNDSDFAMLNDDHLMQHQLENLIAEYSLDLKKTVECTSLEALISMVSAGVGAALVPACLSRFNAQNVAYFGLVQHTALRDIVMIYRRDHYISKAVMAFMDCARRILK